MYILLLQTPAAHVRFHCIFPPLPGSPSLPSTTDLYACDPADIFILISQANMNMSLLAYFTHVWWHFFHSRLSPNRSIFNMILIAYSIDMSQHPLFCCIHPSSILCVTGLVSQSYMSAGLIYGPGRYCANFAKCLGGWSQYQLSVYLNTFDCLLWQYNENLIWIHSHRNN